MGEKMTAPDRDPFAFEIAGAIIAPQHNHIGRNLRDNPEKNTLNAIIRPLLFPSFAHSPA